MYWDIPGCQVGRIWQKNPPTPSEKSSTNKPTDKHSVRASEEHTFGDEAPHFIDASGSDRHQWAKVFRINFSAKKISSRSDKILKWNLYFLLYEHEFECEFKSVKNRRPHWVCQVKSVSDYQLEVTSRRSTEIQYHLIPATIQIVLDHH